MNLHVCLPLTLLIILSRRPPRTKSNFDRTSARRHSGFDSTNSYDNHQESLRKQNTYQNNLDLTDSTLRQSNDVIISSNGQDESTLSYAGGGDIDNDDDSDEYVV